MAQRWEYLVEQPHDTGSTEQGLAAIREIFSKAAREDWEFVGPVRGKSAYDFLIFRRTAAG